MKIRAMRSLRRFENLGESVIALVERVSDFVSLVGATFMAVLRGPFPFSLCVEQFHVLVIRSAPLVFVTATSTGAVMALQFGYGMERFGGKLYVPTIVSISIVRVLGPVFTCLMLAGRAGAGVAAELGGMKVSQQVDALRALGSDPVRKLVLPRVVALTLGAPLLTLLADILGIVGGMVVSTSALGISSSLYLEKAYSAISLADICVGTGKTVAFGMFIGFLGCFNGLRTKDGTAGIGFSTTQAVVLGSIVIMVGDVLFTKLSFLFGW
jgi:phospholipid/cholesterol/gamma-HCH transport system permease protein